jgi:hypothetical protein
MSKLRDVLLLVLILLVLGSYADRKVHAQSGVAIPYTIVGGGGTHTSCPAFASGTPVAVCFPSDGVWYWNGSVWAQQFSGTTAGVTSWNGLTGAVTYTPPSAPVISVNGKTGAVTLTATLQ